MRNITLSADEKLVERAREVARRQGTTLNQLIRAYLESLVGRGAGADTAADLFAAMDAHPGDSGGRRIRREEAYEGRV